ncbi:MAG: Fimbrial assembly protein (PilN) [Firmicutes bacterium]|nr:Fimbrial assembly protein (PilN) [Bacillota bacterium]
MIRINLLPPSQRNPQHSLNRIFLIAGVAIFLLCVVFYGCGSYKLWTLHREIIEIRKQNALLYPTQIKMQALETMDRRIQHKNTVLLSLTAQRISQYASITQLTEALPRDVWLNEIVLDEQHYCHVKGQAVTYSDLAVFFDRIENEALFEKPVLVKAERDKLLNTMKFEITVKGREM